MGLNLKRNAKVNGINMYSPPKKRGEIPISLLWHHLYLEMSNIHSSMNQLPTKDESLPPLKKIGSTKDFLDSFGKQKQSKDKMARQIQELSPKISRPTPP